MIKPRFNSDDTDDARAARAIALHVLHNIVRLVHPLAPFVTEELWSHIRPCLADAPEHIAVAPWPAYEAGHVDQELDEAMQQVFEVIIAIRSVRAEMKIPAARAVDCVIRADQPRLEKHLKDLADNIRILGKVGRLEIDPRVKKPIPSATAVIRDAEIIIPLQGLIDVDAERRRLERELARYAEQLEKVSRKLENQDFLTNAPADVVAKEKAKREDMEKIVARLNVNLEQLLGW